MEHFPTDQLAKHFAKDFPLKHEGLDELLSSFRSVRIPRQSLLLESEGYERKLRFLHRGVVREYYADTEKEININFYTRPQFITDFYSFMHAEPTRKNQEALSELEVLELGKDTFLALLEKYSCGRQFVETVFQRMLRQKELQEYNRMTKEPEVLYQELQATRPDWLQKVPQYHIASYLRITPETLSRIRKRIS